MGDVQVDLNKSLVCVEYPGIVQNVDKMLETLGGLRNISKAYCTRNRRLELRYRPNDQFCKPTCGDKFKTMALIMKVRIKRPKTGTTTNSPESKPQVVSSEIIGRVHTIYKFTALCDFQYLTMHKDSNGSLRCTYDEIVPNGMPSAAWIGPSAPLFMTPATFSRIDNQQNVSMALDSSSNNSANQHDANATTTTTNASSGNTNNTGSSAGNTTTSGGGDLMHNVIGRTRRRRSGHAIFLTYKTAPAEAPRAPHRKCLNMLQVKFLDGPQLTTLRKLFEERPVWSKNALLYVSGQTIEKLKFLLPAVAYYYVTGPWRAMWVRFGYDPRKDYRARVYQTLDYRLRATGGLKTVIKAKRSCTNYILPYKTGSSCKPKTVVLGKGGASGHHSTRGGWGNRTRHHTASGGGGARKGPLNENIYILRAGMIPPSRQMFYQYCDLLIPEIQTMLARLPIPSCSTTGSSNAIGPAAAASSSTNHNHPQCDSRRGWLPPGFDERCREIIHKLVYERVRACAGSDNKMAAGAKHEDEAYGGDDDEYEDIDEDEQTQQGVGEIDEMHDSAKRAKKTDESAQRGEVVAMEEEETATTEDNDC